MAKIRLNREGTAGIQATCFVSQSPSHFLCLVISGVAMGASWIFLFEAYIKIGVSIATLAYYCGPVIVMILSLVMFREKITSAKLLGFLAVIIGMLCVLLTACL